MEIIKGIYKPIGLVKRGLGGSTEVAYLPGPSLPAKSPSPVPKDHLFLPSKKQKYFTKILIFDQGTI